MNRFETIELYSAIYTAEAVSEQIDKYALCAKKSIERISFSNANDFEVHDAIIDLNHFASKLELWMLVLEKIKSREKGDK